MMRRSPLKQGSPLERKTLMKSAGFARSDRKEAQAVAKLRRAITPANETFPQSRESKPSKLPKSTKSRGMKGRPPTVEEARFMDAIAALGCIACRKDGRENLMVSIHHIDGRTKPGAHFLTLPLCGPHHQQDDTDPRARISLHGRKATFKARYGTERELLAECIELLGYGGDDHEIREAA
jgi:hypothetical protein